MILAQVCTYILVNSGDSCASLATRCKISAADFTKYNPSSTLCSTLTIGEPVCCSSGSLPNLTPQKNPDGTCASYTVKTGDYCGLIAQNNHITVDNIEAYNTKTWGWNGCGNLQLGANICLSSGDPPMPASVSGTVCGPQVPGTKRPSSWSQISSLNPCPLNACCDIWGQCGITPDFCTSSNSSTGAPGTAAPGSNGCISNCGTSIVNNVSPTEFKSIGYFESFGSNRSCLAMDASQIPTSYSHIHYAFGSITSDFQVDLSDNFNQFKIFANSTGFKRILSFGGWSFSTDLDSAPIFRQGVTDANRQTFAQSVVNTINQYNLDGVDFDWEYPDADIPGLPIGSPTDGPNYLSFLKDVRAILPTGKSISIAAPASYYYLKGFPIADMANVLDYIVYMTYDLHGQWDYNKTFSNPGCPTGNCLRSHVNLTETEYALSMITKAGVPTNKIVVGVAGYGRSFGMVNPSCTGPTCLFTGPDSTASPGDCTATAGYISQAELEALSNPSQGSLSRRGINTWHDNSSDSDIMTYGNGTWVAYMTQDTKTSRINRYASQNFGGSVEWAVDLVQFVGTLEEAEDSLNLTALENDFTAALSLSGYDTSDFAEYNFTDLSTRLIGWNGCYKSKGFPRVAIYSGWQQSWAIMNNLYKEANAGVDFSSGAAIEYLGPPSQNLDQRAGFTSIFKNLATIQPGWVITRPFQWRLPVRCDDPDGACTQCGEGEVGSTTFAYRVEGDPLFDGASSINFCPAYFSADTIQAKMAYADKKKFPDTTYANMDTYKNNQASIWIHELMHIDWVTLADKYGSNRHIKDRSARFRTTADELKTIKAYGPLWTKGIARFRPKGSETTGNITITNADSISLYALARYVQKALGLYPHLPEANYVPEKVVGSFVMDDLFTLETNGTIQAITNEWDTDVGVCAALDDGDNADNDFAVDDISQVLVQSDFPADYLSSWSSWAGLTPTTTTSAAPSPTARWSIAIYSEQDCAGDYYVVGGYNLDSPSDQCIALRGGNLPQTSTTGTACRWFTNGGNTWSDCSGSTLTQPLSWSVVGGVCTAYDTDGCTDDGNSNAYDPAEGCYNYNAANHDTKTWVSLQCGSQPDIGELRVRPLKTVTSTVVVNGTGLYKANYTSTVTRPVDPALKSSFRFQSRPTTSVQT